MNAKSMMSVGLQFEQNYKTVKPLLHSVTLLFHSIIVIYY